MAETGKGNPPGPSKPTPGPEPLQPSTTFGGAAFALGANQHTTTRESAHNTPSGTEHVVERHDVCPSSARRVARLGGIGSGRQR